MRNRAVPIVILLLLIPAAAYAAATLVPTPGSASFGARCVRTYAGAKTVTVTNTSNRDRAENVQVKISPAPMSTIFPLSGTTAVPTLRPDGDAFDFGVAFVPGKAGSNDAVARITYTSIDPDGDPSSRSTAVPVSGEGIDRFIDVSPTELGFGDVRVGSSARARTVTVFDDGASPLRITQVAIVGPDASDFSVQPTGAVTITESSPLRLQVGFEPGGVGARSARLRIRSNSCTDPVRTVALAGTGVTQDIVALPGEVDFGAIEPGRDATKRVAIANQGGASLTVESISLARDRAGVFRVLELPTLPRSLSPGESLTVAIRFSAPAGASGPDPSATPTPGSGPSLRALLRVESSDGDSPVLRVPVLAQIQQAAATVTPSPVTTAQDTPSPSPTAVGAGPSIADFGAEARVIALVLAFFGLLIAVRRLRGAPD